MRKTPMYLFAAAALFTVTAAPLSGYAASVEVRLPAGQANAMMQGAMVIKGRSLDEVKAQLGELGIREDVMDQILECLPMVPGQPSKPIFPQQPTPPIQPETPDQPSVPDVPPTQDTAAGQVVDLVNAERAKAGLSPLTVNEKVQAAADVRAREIATSFSHTRPDGSSYQTALNAQGVTYRAVGENIAYGRTTPEAVMNDWMNSEGHRANILNKDFTTIGVGHYIDESGTQYWGQLFTK